MGCKLTAITVAVHGPAIALAIVVDIAGITLVIVSASLAQERVAGPRTGAELVKALPTADSLIVPGLGSCFTCCILYRRAKQNH